MAEANVTVEGQWQIILMSWFRTVDRMPSSTLVCRVKVLMNRFNQAMCGADTKSTATLDKIIIE